MRKTVVVASMAALLSAAGSYAEVPANPTYTKDVAPILYENCASCHRAGQIGPMSLLTYGEVRPWAKSISKNVSEGTMPPWHADEGFGPWIEDRSLAQDKIDTIVKWVEQGAKRGNPKDMPAAPKFPEGDWQLGEPDLEIIFDEYDVPAGGPDRFHDHLYQTETEEDKWITDVEILPGANEVVHHVILWQGDRDDQNPTGWVGAWAAGAEPMQFPEGTGRMLKKGSMIRGDMHYHPSDKAHTDQTRIGFHFADGEVEKELVNLWVMNNEFAIPAGAENHQVRSRYTFMEDSHLISLTPHMHYRGKDFKYTAKFPDGSSKDLLMVSDYDFNWQTEYRFENPEAMPEGTVIECVAHFDNSTNNEANPDPTKTIYFGPESYDEMMIGFIDYVVDEGVRPTVEVDPIEQKLENLMQEFSGDLYTLNVPVDPSKGMQKTIVLMPHEGRGAWYIPIANFAARAEITDITWTGNDWAGTLHIPGEDPQELKGSINPAAKEITVIMRGFPLKGQLAE